MASIDFYAGTTAINNLSGSGLGFFGGSFGQSVELNQWQGTTFITNGNGTTQGGAATELCAGARSAPAWPPSTDQMAPPKGTPPRTPGTASTCPYETPPGASGQSVPLEPPSSTQCAPSATPSPVPSPGTLDTH